jgi:hypothetical protein
MVINIIFSYLNLHNLNVFLEKITFTYPFWGWGGGWGMGFEYQK